LYHPTATVSSQALSCADEDEDNSEDRLAV
jgi:hypothetical protein